MTNLLPLAGFVLVEPEVSKTETSSGIILPDSSETSSQQGTVIATGDCLYVDGWKVECPVSPGMKVVYREWGGKEYKENGVNLLLLKFEDLMAY
jgi:co-chaperonin GroES (HSP10)